MVVPFTEFVTKKWAVLTSKIDKLLFVIGIMPNRLICHYMHSILGEDTISNKVLIETIRLSNH